MRDTFDAPAGEPLPAYLKPVGEAAHLIAELQKAALAAEVRMAGGRNGVGEGGVIGQRHMEAGDARLLQQWDEHGQLLLQNAGAAVGGMGLADGELIVDGDVRQPPPHGGHRLHREPGPIFGAAAVAAVDLHHVEAGFQGQLCRRAEGVRDGADFLGGEAGDVGAYLPV